METFKRRDFWLSLVLITGSTIFSLIKKDYTFIYCYLITGTWQVISITVHAINGWFTRKKSTRYIYHWAVAIIIVLGLLAFILPIFFFIYYIMLFIAPIMAITYTFICYEEVKQIKQRHLLALK